MGFGRSCREGIPFMSGELELVGIGSMVLDRIHLTRRLLAPGQKGLLDAAPSGGTVETCIGGVLLNQLGWASLFGIRTGLFGRQADDDIGRALRTAMKRAGIETNLDLSGSSSSIAEIFVDAKGERTIYMAPGATAETTPDHVRKDHANFIASGKRLTTEVSQLPLDATLEALRIAHARGLVTVVDLDVLPSDAIRSLGDRATLDAVLGEADLLKATDSAARELFAEIDGGEELVAAIRERYGAATVVMTEGEAGSVLCDERGARRIAAYTAETVIDSTGAGDAFLGGLLAGEALGLGIDDAAKLGNACGTACIEQVGAFPEQPQALRARILELFDGPALKDARWTKLVAEDASPGATSEPGRRVLEIAASELAALEERHDGTALRAAAELIESSQAAGGRVHVTGVGKSEHVARYGASLFSSTGTPASFLHATELFHGSLGQIVPGDVIVAISNSGTTAECLTAVEAIRSVGGRVIAVTGGLTSELALQAEVILDAGVGDEGGPLGLAPRASVAAEVVVLAALGAELQARRGFDQSDYAARHPAGALGERARGGGRKPAD